MVFGAGRAPRGPLRHTIYRVWGQESGPRSTLTYYLQCLGPGQCPEVHFDLQFTVFRARRANPFLGCHRVLSVGTGSPPPNLPQ
eukprot:16082983-Heterocapsa_arctica.AAC.1